MRHLFLSNKELKAVLNVSESTISRVANGKARRDNALRGLKPIYIGESRRWNASEVAAALGITVEEIERILE